ncbi:MAG: RbsD/FucU family protein [Lachnospiraceae bacterium]|nr:RbsD/FucU family protein [Lachnospiraceae bacterium]
MLKNIPPILSPELLAVLAEMGHGDRICIGDGNFPGASMAAAEGAILVRADGHGVPALLDAIMQVIPLDEYVETPAMIMEVMPQDKDLELPIIDEYKKIVAKYDERGEKAFGSYERFEFYEQAKKCYCIIQSGETAIYANLILQKGVVK